MILLKLSVAKKRVSIVVERCKGKVRKGTVFETGRGA
jgi:hypothetical protein